MLDQRAPGGEEDNGKDFQRYHPQEQVLLILLRRRGEVEPRQERHAERTSVQCDGAEDTLLEAKPGRIGQQQDDRILNGGPLRDEFQGCPPVVHGRQIDFEADLEEEKDKTDLAQFGEKDADRGLHKTADKQAQHEIDRVDQRRTTQPLANVGYEKEEQQETDY